MTNLPPNKHSMWSQFDQKPGTTDNRYVLPAVMIGGGLILAGLAYLIIHAAREARLEDQLNNAQVQLSMLGPMMSELYQAMPSKEELYVKGTQAAYELSRFVRI